MHARRILAALAVAVLASPLFSQEVPNAPAVPQRDYLDAWPGYIVFPWSYHTPPLNDATARAYREQGVNGIHVDRLIAASQAEWVDEHQFPFYIDHAAGKGSLFLQYSLGKSLVGSIEKVPAEYQAGEGLIRRPKCLHDPKVLADMEALVRQNVAAAARHGVVCYSLDDEISTGSFDDPVETCWCEHCQGAFRKFALGLYGGSLSKLNAEWGTDFKTEDEIRPATADYAVKQAAAKPVDRWNFARWADFRQFMDQTLVDALVRLTQVANEVDPKHPAGFEGGQQPAPYGGFDYSRISRSVQWIEAYDIGSNNEIVRSLAPKVVRMKTFFSAKNKAQDSNRLWYHFMHGDRGVILWPSTDKDNHWWNADAQIRPDLAYLPGIFKDLTSPRVANLLAGAEFVDDGVAVYYSQPSIRAAWIMDASVHGETWRGHSGGIDRYFGSVLVGRYAWLTMLEDAGLQYNFIDAAKLAAGELAFPRYKALILPAIHAMSDAEAAAIRKFAAAGGVVIADYLPGILDEHCGSRGGKGALDDLFGVKHDWSKGLFDGKHVTYIDGEKYKGPLIDAVLHEGIQTPDTWPIVERGLTGARRLEQSGAHPAYMVSEGGRVVCMNLSPVLYLLMRYTCKEGGHESWLAETLAKAGVKPAVQVQTAGNSNEVLRWKKGGRVYVCIVKNPQADQKDWKWEEMAPIIGLSDKPADLRVKLVRPNAAGPVVNVRTGKPVEAAVADDGSVSFTDTWVPCQAAIYSYAEKAGK